MLKTTYQVFDSPTAGKTIVFNNLYFINGEFIFNGTASNSEIATYFGVHYRHDNFKQWMPSIRDLLEDTIQVITTPHFYLKETLRYHPVHTLMDDIFSVFYSLYRCKLNYNPYVCVLEIPDEYNTSEFYDCRGMFKCLFGQEAITSHHIKRIHSKVCFQTFVVGNGDSGLHSYDSNYAAPFQDDIWKQFRNAFYEKSEISLELGSKIIYADSNNWPINGALKDILEKNDISIINWSDFPTIKDQLNLLKNVKIYIATEGADILNAIFLPDNAIVINLGRMYANGSYKVLGYCVDWIWPSLSYIDVFYLEDYCLRYHKTQELIPSSEELMQIVRTLNDTPSNSLLVKRKEIYDNFASKAVDKIDYTLKLNNFSPNARLLIENFSNLERAKIIESFKRGSAAYACNDKIRSFRID